METMAPLTAPYAPRSPSEKMDPQQEDQPRPKTAKPSKNTKRKRKQGDAGREPDGEYKPHYSHKRGKGNTVGIARW